MLTCVRFRILVSVPLGCMYPWYSSSLRRLVCTVSADCCIRRDCVDDVGCADEVEGAAGNGCLTDGTTASGSDDALSLFSDRRMDFLT